MLPKFIVQDGNLHSQITRIGNRGDFTVWIDKDKKNIYIKKSSKWFSTKYYMGGFSTQDGSNKLTIRLKHNKYDRVPLALFEIPLTNDKLIAYLQELQLLSNSELDDDDDIVPEVKEHQPISANMGGKYLRSIKKNLKKQKKSKKRNSKRRNKSKRNKKSRRLRNKRHN